MCMFTCTYTHTCTPMVFFSPLSFVLFQQQNLKAQLPPTEGLFLPHLPMQAVWCWVKPGGHLHAKLPMVLTHRNWQLCCLVAHSSRSTRKCKTGIGVEHTAQAVEATLGRSSEFSLLGLQWPGPQQGHSKRLGRAPERRVGKIRGLDLDWKM